MSEKFHGAFSASFKLSSIPYRRYVFAIPEPIFAIVKDIEKFLFLEDIIVISAIEKELLFPLGEFKTLMIGKHLSFQKFLILFRAIYCLHHLVGPKLLEQLKHDEEAVLSSLSPIYTEIN